MEMDTSIRPSGFTPLKKLVVCAMLVALGVVLSGVLSIPITLDGSPSAKIGFGPLPIIFAGILFGPLYGAMAAAVWDILTALIFPVGAYLPWFTLSAVLFGLLPGLFFMKKQDYKFGRVFLATASPLVLVSIFINTFLIIILYWKDPFAAGTLFGMEIPKWLAVVAVRAMEQVVTIPLYSALIYNLLRLLKHHAVIE